MRSGVRVYEGAATYYGSNMAELIALWQGLKIGLEQNLISLEITTDSEEVIRMLKHRHLPYNFSICECRSLMEQLEPSNII